MAVMMTALSCVLAELGRFSGEKRNFAANTYGVPTARTLVRLEILCSRYAT